LTIAVYGGNLRVYDWGKKIADSTVTTTSLQNNDEFLIIGNRKYGDGRFNGFIREIKISSEINESDVLKTAENLAKQINGSN
jgi:hypothetical protein